MLSFNLLLIHHQHLFFGGNWERLYDRFLVGAGDTYGVGQTGGEASHTLTTWEMPTHNHGFANNSYTLGNGGTGDWMGRRFESGYWWS